MPIKETGQLKLSELAEEYRQPLNNISLGKISRTSGLQRLNKSLSFSNLYEYTHPLRGRNPDAIINGIGPDPEPFGESTFNRKIGTLQVLGNFTNNTSGIVFEQGATGVGFSLYFHNGILYSTAGDGSTTSGTIELSYTPTSDEIIDEIITSFNLINGETKAVLFINGELKDYSYDFPNSGNYDIAGTDPGGTGRIYSGIRNTRGSAVQISNGIIERANLFADYFIFPVSNGVSPSYTQNGVGNTGTNGHVNQQETYAVEAYGTFNNETHGIVYESGGQLYGTMIYFYENKLYAQVAESDFTDPDLTNVTSFISIPNSFINKPIYHIAYTSTVTFPTRSELYINYRLVSFDMNHTISDFVGGSDPAAFGKENGTSAESLLDRSANTKGKTLQDAHFTTGLVYNNNSRLQSPMFGKTFTLKINGIGSSGTHMNDARLAIVEAFGKWDYNDEGVLYETGATGIGSVIYLYEGVMYFQSGKGDEIGGDVELSYNLIENKETVYSYMISIDYNSSEAFLFVNGFLVDSNTSWTPTNDFSGTNEGGVGKIYSNISNTRATNNGSWNTPGNSEGIFTGIITTTYLYNNTSI